MDIDIYGRLIDNTDVRAEVMRMMDAAVKYANQLMQYQAACRYGRDSAELGASRRKAHDAFIRTVLDTERVWGEGFPPFEQTGNLGFTRYDRDNRSSHADLAVELARGMMQRMVDQAREPGTTVKHG